jgi:GNAT superfamily N-acetyltransferase
MGTMIFREIKEKDIPGIFEVRVSTDENKLSRAELERLGITQASVLEMLNTTHRGWLCEVDDHVVGFVMGNRITCEMWVIAVLPGYINQGIGTKLLKLVEDWLWNCGCKKIWLTTDVNQRLRAYSFYIRNGWKDDYIYDHLRYMRKDKTY